MTESTRARLERLASELRDGAMVAGDPPETRHAAFAMRAVWILVEEVELLRAEIDKHPAPHVSGEQPWFANWRGQSVEMVEGSTYEVHDGAIYRIMGDDGGDLGDHAPPDPTPAMIEAGMMLVKEIAGGGDLAAHRHDAIRIYRAMEAAKR